MNTIVDRGASTINQANSQESVSMAHKSGHAKVWRFISRLLELLWSSIGTLELSQYHRNGDEYMEPKLHHNISMRAKSLNAERSAYGGIFRIHENGLRQFLLHVYQRQGLDFAANARVIGRPELNSARTLIATYESKFLVSIIPSCVDGPT